MQHLDVERIAAFDHEPPSVDELAHLALCRTCRAERVAMNELSQMAINAGVQPIGANAPRLTNWENLSGRLRVEGLIADTPVPAQTRSLAGMFDSRRMVQWSRVAAAAVVLLAVGAATGRYSAGAPVMPFANGASALNGGGAFSSGNAEFSSLDEANRVLTRAQSDYERASLFLAANDTTVNSSEMVRRRLAALDQMVAASRAGLQDAPQDPVLNHYYTAAYTAREATLAQLGVALPVNKLIERF